jgi:hypothetical protein
MRARSFLLALLLLTPGLGHAQPKPSTESVTVTGTKDRQAIESFVQSLAVPTRAAEKLARWQQGICPVAVGLKPAFLNFITQHLKDIAAQVGAPVNSSPSCEHNIAIVFTTAPQALADNARKKKPALLGYHENQEQLDKLATVSHPIQAWYMTATQDAHGQTTPDSGKTTGEGLVLMFQDPVSGAQYSITYPSAHAAATNDSHLGDGLRSTLFNIVIVADPTKLGDYQIGALADYIAMLALAQITLPDGCQQLPSVLNMLAAGCAQKTDALTDNDIAYLKGLYKMGPDLFAKVQKGEIAYQMQQSLDGKQ